MKGSSSTQLGTPRVNVSGISKLGEKGAKQYCSVHGLTLRLDLGTRRPYLWLQSSNLENEVSHPIKTEDSPFRA